MTPPAPPPATTGDTRPALPSGVTYLPCNLVDRGVCTQDIGDDVRSDHPDGTLLVIADPGGLVVHYDFRSLDGQNTPFWMTDSLRSTDLLRPADLGTLYAAYGTTTFDALKELPDIHECRRQGVTVRDAVLALTAALLD